MIPRLSPRAAVGRWAVHAQLTARHNARVAATGMAQRRVERLDVEAYLASRATSPPPRRATVHR